VRNGLGWLEENQRGEQNINTEDKSHAFRIKKKKPSGCTSNTGGKTETKGAKKFEERQRTIAKKTFEMGCKKKNSQKYHPNGGLPSGRPTKRKKI